MISEGKLFAGVANDFEWEKFNGGFPNLLLVLPAFCAVWNLDFINWLLKLDMLQHRETNLRMHADDMLILFNPNAM